MMEVAQSEERSVPGGWLGILTVVVAAWAVLLWAAPLTPVSSDATRDQLLVRDCLELGRCHTAGAPTSVSGIRQGAAWIDLLALLRLAGLDVEGQRVATLLLNALTIGVLFAVAGRLRRRWAWPTAWVALFAIVTGGTEALLINTSLDVLPATVGAAALLLFAVERRRGLLVAAALALGLAVDFHVSAAALLPALLFVAASSSLADLLIAVLLSAGAALATSWDAWRMNLEELGRRGLLLPGVALLMLVILAGRALRKVQAHRPWMTLLALVVPLLCGALVLVLVEKHGFQPSYLHPVLGPASLILVMGLDGGLKRLARSEWGPRTLLLAFATVVLFVASQEHERALGRMTQVWSYDEARIIARGLAEHGLSHADALSRLQGPGCHELLPAVGVYMPRPGESRASTVAYSVAHGAAGALTGLPSWLKSSAWKACRTPAAGGEPVCAPAAPPVGGERAAPDRFLFSSRTDIATHVPALPAPFTARYELPIEAASASRVLSVLDDGPEECRWRISGAQGVEVKERLPATRVVLTAKPGQTGTLILEKPFGPSGCATRAVESLFLPCLKESEP